MKLDLHNLTPAPWEGYQGDTDDAQTVYVQVVGPDRKCLFDTCNSTAAVVSDDSDSDGPYFRDEVGLANLRFAAAARNAFDVMMRRKIFPIIRCGKWAVDVAPCQHISADDPFTALIEADAWYKQNVEKTEAKS